MTELVAAAEAAAKLGTVVEGIISIAVVSVKVGGGVAVGADVAGGVAGGLGGIAAGLDMVIGGIGGRGFVAAGGAAGGATCLRTIIGKLVCELKPCADKAEVPRRSMSTVFRLYMIKCWCRRAER